MRMKPTTILRCGAAITLPWIALASASAQTTDQAAEPAAAIEASSEGDIVVTASKRAESLTAVPASIAVLSAETMEKRGIENFSDYVRAVPGLSAVEAAAPGRGAAAIRGVNSGVKQNAPTVVFYLDDLPLTASSPLAVSGTNIFDPDLADVERIEVLKGPQSTLYGASAMGGLIKIVTTKPDFDKFSGSARGDFGVIDGGGSIYGARAALNIPLADDRAALRVSGYARHNGGFVGNARYNQDNVNDSDSYGGRLALRFKVNDWLETSFSGMYQHSEGDAYAYTTLDPVTLKPLFGKYNFDLRYNTEFETEYKVIANTTTADAGFADITNTLSYTKTDDFFIRDYSAAYYGFIPGGTPAYGVRGPNKSSTGRWTDELRIASKEGTPFEWMLGVFYTSEKDYYSAHITGNDPVTDAVLPLPGGNVYTFDLYAKYKEIAGFGNVTYNFSDKFEVTAGLRYSHNDQDFRSPRSGILGATPITPKSSSDSATTYLFTASYHPTPKSSIYARAASAYRPGSTQPLSSASAPDQYGPDKLWNYEIGMKGDWLNGMLSTEVALYHIDWTDIQLNSLVGGFSVISNAGKAESEGFEVTVGLRPTKGLSLGGNLAYNRARILTSNPSIGAVAGDPLPFGPDWTGSFSADYTTPLSDGIDGRIGASYSHQGSRFTALSGDVANTRYRLPAYDTFDLRAGLDIGAYSVAFRVDNLTNKYALSSAQRIRLNATQNNPVTATVIRPRTAMLSLGMKF